MENEENSDHGILIAVLVTHDFDYNQSIFKIDFVNYLLIDIYGYAVSR